MADAPTFCEPDARFRRKNKLEALGALAGAVAQEFNNLLQVIHGYTRCAIDEMDGQAPACQDLEQVLHAASKATRLAGQLLALSRAPTDRELIDPNAVVAESALAITQLVGQQIKLDVFLGRDVGLVQADPEALRHALLNLCLNARDAMPSGGRLAIRTASVLVGRSDESPDPMLMPGRYVLVAVSDSGQGMPADIRDRLFDPFRSSGPHLDDPGLGLAAVYGIVRQHAGTVVVNSEPGAGTTMKIFLPLASDAAESSLDEVQHATA
jgi:signal transduction histidine kinase